MSSAFATETTQVSARFVNQSFLSAIEGGRLKEAAEEGTNFIREIVRQAAAVREILPPVGLQDDEIDRDETTDEPKKIIEKEPQSVATFVELQGTPSAYYFKGPRYAVYFGKIVSLKATKSKTQLMTYVNDIRQLLADNFTKDMADVEDKRWRATNQMLVSQNVAQQTVMPAFTATAFKKAMQALLARRRPLGKMLMTKQLMLEALDLSAMTVGYDVATAHYREGVEKEERLWGMPVVSTIKSDIYQPNEVWLYSPQNFLGNFFTLQDATLFIKQEADMIEFYTYEILGIGIGNRLSIQQLTFPTV